MRIQTVKLGLAAACASVPAQAEGPVIDMHVHADTVNNYPPDMLYCVPLMDNEPALDPARDYLAQYLEAWQNPSCESPIPAATDDETLMRETILRLEERNAIGLLQGPPERVRKWIAAAPGRFLPSLQFNVSRKGDATPEEMRELFTDGGFLMLGEVSNQYGGGMPDDPRMGEVWALVEELDIPVGYHMGLGPPGAHSMFPDYSVAAGNPLLLEPILHRHPNLRISIQHMASGFHDELKMMLWTYPQLYVELSGPITWSDDFHTYLEDLVDAGLTSRILFGSDALIWPEVFDRSVDIIEQADYLTEEQKRDILFNNAVRFLKLDPEEAKARTMGEAAE